MNGLMIKQFGFYRNNEFGSFTVRNISRNGLLVTILDAYGEMHKASYLRFQDSIEIDRETFDALYKKLTCRPLYTNRICNNNKTVYVYPSD